jgi:hypothetical protein
MSDTLSAQIPEIVKHFVALGCAKISLRDRQLCVDLASSRNVGKFAVNAFHEDNGCIYWNDTSFACLEDFLTAFEDFVMQLMLQYDLDYENSLKSSKIWIPDENYAGNSDRDDSAGSSAEKVALRDACVIGNASEVMNILRTSPDLIGRAVYQSAFFQQHELLRVVWDSMSSSQLHSRGIATAMMLVARDGNSGLAIEMSKKLGPSHRSIKSLRCRIESACAHHEMIILSLKYVC